jgi:hypothetical protein
MWHTAARQASQLHRFSHDQRKGRALDGTPVGVADQGSAPKFVDLMRNLTCSAEQEAFYFERADYYNAVDYDDSVYRVEKNIEGKAPRYELVVIDEFQDFNRMEAAVIDGLAGVSPIVIAGDDDQALKLAAEKHEPVALIIGGNPYRRQVEEHLMKVGLVTKADDTALSEREQALAILHEDPKSTLGWRIILWSGDEAVARTAVYTAAGKKTPLFDALPADLRARILEEAKAWTGDDDTERENDTVPAVKITSYEGSKGLSAQHVFLIGLHSGDIPRNAEDIKDIEICRLLVALTRTKKKCSILVTKRFGESFKQRSEFLRWVKPARYEEKKVDAAYWKKK